MKKYCLSVGLAAFSVIGVCQAVEPATPAPKKKVLAKKPAAKTVKKSVTPVKTALVKASAVKPAPIKKGYVQTWDEPTYKDSTSADRVIGEDPDIRKAAVGALGPMNGAIVVSDPNTGRVLSIVNQQLALGGGFQPCSTIKVPVALAALREGLVTRVTPGKVPSKFAPDLTDALAFSNNSYFANLGIKLGYDRVNYSRAPVRLRRKRPASTSKKRALPATSRPLLPKTAEWGCLIASFGEEISQTPAGNRRSHGCGRERRHALLAAVPDVRCRYQKFPAACQTASGHCRPWSTPSNRACRARFSSERRDGRGRMILSWGRPEPAAKDVPTSAGLPLLWTLPIASWWLSFS